MRSESDPAGIDGDFGSNSRGALERFRMARGVDELFAGATKPELEDWQAFAALYSEAIAEAAGAALSDWEALRQKWRIRDPKCVAAGTTWTREDVAVTGYKVAQGSRAVVNCFIFADYANPWYSGEQGLPAQAIDAESIFAAKNVDSSTPDQPPDLGKNAAKGAKKKEIMLHTFGQPRVFDDVLAAHFHRSFPYFRCHHQYDPVAQIPITTLNDRVAGFCVHSDNGPKSFQVLVRHRGSFNT
jgi:hypothetical protein